jgi:hypothetical protein
MLIQVYDKIVTHPRPVSTPRKFFERDARRVNLERQTKRLSMIETRIILPSVTKRVW